MQNNREKFATQIDPSLLIELRQLSEAEGKKIQFLVEEALQLLLDKRLNEKTPLDTMAAYRKSHAKYADLYSKLAQ